MAIAIDLMIIGERYLFTSREDWFCKLQEIYALLDEYPSVRLQIRSKNSAKDKIWIIPQIEPHPQVLLNGSPLEKGRFSMHFPEALMPLNQQPFQFGVSIHDEVSLGKAISIGASYVQYGPIFSPISKVASPVGLDSLSTIVSISSIPVIAVGGVTLNNVEHMISAGASGVASASTILKAKQPKKMIERFLSRMNSARS